MANPQDDSEQTTICVSRGMQDRLWKLKAHRSESYEKLLIRLLAKIETPDDDNLNNIR